MISEDLSSFIEEKRRQGDLWVDLSGKGLTDLPPNIGSLFRLLHLDLSDNQLSKLPPAICRLVNLKTLNLGNNRLKELPGDIGSLSKLTKLNLSNNQLSALPASLSTLSSLTSLNLGGNRFDRYPVEVDQLTELQSLSLKGIALGTLPPSIIENLSRLRVLDVSYTFLNALPSEINQLFYLEQLIAGDNLLTELPSSIGDLVKLWRLHVQNNRLVELPPEIGLLKGLKKLPLEAVKQGERLLLGGNPLVFPPPEIVQQGTEACIAYLAQVLRGASRKWVSKVLVVGQGGVGKTCLLRAVSGRSFQPQESTHGIEIRSLKLKHPTKTDVTMELKAWDFGGQEIYQATHQFFLTNRSLFLLVWNSRHGFEQGRIFYWLDTIQALAPESPVLLVATWIDERKADLPLSELRRKYPQVVGQCSVSNLTGEGIDVARDVISDIACRLPLMGEMWPSTWLDAAETIRSFPEKHVSPKRLFNLMSSHGVQDTSFQILARWLHELGDILFFADNEELADTVILKPQWVTQYISRVLDSDEVGSAQGVFSRGLMKTLWDDLEPVMREHFLRLMERFDLSYRALENRGISIVVERLPFDEPDYHQIWDEPLKSQCSEISMKFILSTIPAGIPTWFIARFHRFTTHTHWRTGALFAQESEHKHLALIQAFSHERYVRLTVRGPNPQNFFSLLMSGIEWTFTRFPGLRISRLIPCPGHGGRPCTHEFEYEQLQNRLGRKPEIECPQALENVSLTTLLFGIHSNTGDEVLTRLNELEDRAEERHEEVLDAIENLQVLTQREFTNIFRRAQSDLETCCPNVFLLRARAPSSVRRFLRAQGLLGNRQFDFQLLCQEPGSWHPTLKGGAYLIKEPAQWFKEMAPYLRRLMSVLKHAAPVVGPWLNIANLGEYQEQLKSDFELVEVIIQELPKIRNEADYDFTSDIGDEKVAEGSSLRALRTFLEHEDPRKRWGGLRRIITPEGHYLWLCEFHAEKYL